MNFIGLVEKTWLKCGLTGPGPSTVAGQTDINARIVMYVQHANRHIQQRANDWDFLWRRSNPVNLIIGTADYLPGDLGVTNFKRFSRVQKQVGGRWLPIEVEALHRSDEDGLSAYDNISSGQPSKIIERPDGKWQFNRIPDQAYPVRVEYYRTPVELEANEDQPPFPEEFHWAIIWKAVESYSYYDEDVSLNTEAEREFAGVLHRMATIHRPEMTFAQSEFL